MDACMSLRIIPRSKASKAASSNRKTETDDLLPWYDLPRRRGVYFRFPDERGHGQHHELFEDARLRKARRSRNLHPELGQFIAHASDDRVDRRGPASRQRRSGARATHEPAESLRNDQLRRFESAGSGKAAPRSAR